MNRYRDEKLDMRVYEDMTEVLAIKPSAKNANQHEINFGIEGACFSKHPGWYGLPSYAEFIDAYAHGWSDGAKRMEELTDSLPDIKTTSVKRKRIRNRFGNHLDIHAVYGGRFETCWEDRERKSVHGKKSISIIYHANLSGSSPSSYVFARGAVAVKLADLYRKAGYHVSIHALMATYNIETSKPRKHLYFFPVLPMGANASLEKMAACALAGVCRVFEFWAHEETEVKINSGYGMVWRISESELRELIPDSLPIDRQNLIYIPEHVNDMSKAVNFINSLGEN